MDEFIASASTIGLDIGLKVLGAIAVWVIGQKIIGLAQRLLRATVDRRHFEPTLARYLVSAAGVGLNLLLVVTVLGVFGVDTTSFAALFAAAGVAIGMAWSGLLSNFAAGLMMIILRPFKSGDFVEVAGQLGTVQEVGMFVTGIDTMDNVRTIIGNAQVFGGIIRNFSANPVRRVDCVAQLAHGADHGRAIDALRAALVALPHVAKDPSPVVEIVDFTLAGPVLAVRPFTHTDHYWDVYFATNKAIREELGKLGLPVPETHHKVDGGELVVAGARTAGRVN
ncbi:MAG: mechanosensitive ion channel protein [Myxococcales bacterium]